MTHDNADSVKPHAPDFALVSERHLTESQGAQIVESWRSRYTSRLIVLAPGMKITRLPTPIAGGRPGIVWGLRSPDGASRL